MDADHRLIRPDQISGGAVPLRCHLIRQPGITLPNIGQTRPAHYSYRPPTHSVSQYTRVFPRPEQSSLGRRTKDAYALTWSGACRVARVVRSRSRRNARPEFLRPHLLPRAPAEKSLTRVPVGWRSQPSIDPGSRPVLTSAPKSAAVMPTTGGCKSSRDSARGPIPSCWPTPELTDLNVEDGDLRARASAFADQ